MPSIGINRRSTGNTDVLSLNIKLGGLTEKQASLDTQLPELTISQS